jgi:hypothetical protein
MEYFELEDGPNPIGYYFDRVALSFFDPVGQIRKLLPLAKIKNEFKSCSLSERSYETRQGWIMSKLDIVAPTTNCIRILLEIFPVPESYKISYLEIAKDILFESNSEAIGHYSHIDDKLAKKFTPEYKHFDRNYYKDKKSDKDPTLISDWSSCYGRLFQYFIYARLSKINGSPCFHQEWRIKRTGLIRRKAHIFSLGDLLTFSFGPFFKYCDEKYLDFREIDNIKLGKWLRGMDRRKSLSRRQILGIGCSAQQFLSMHNIHNYAGLKDLLAKEKMRLKRIPGRRPPYMERVFRLKDCGKFQRKMASMEEL